MPKLNVLDLDGDDVNYIGTELDDLLKNINDYLTSTPDYPELQKWDSHYVFIYDGLKAGFNRDRHLQDYDTLAVGWTKANLRLRKSSGANSYAVAMVDGSDKSKAAPLYGELYQVRPETMRELDWLYSNTFMCRRFKMPIEAIIDSKGTTKQIYAWTYIHLQSYWASRIDRLEECDILTANNNGKKYYNYMRKYETMVNAA